MDLLVKFARPFFFFSNCRTEIREVRARRDLRGPLVLPPHLTDKEMIPINMLELELRFPDAKSIVLSTVV